MQQYPLPPRSSEEGLNLAEIFYNSPAFNIIPFPNIWEDNGPPGMFIPANQPLVNPYGEYIVGVDPHRRDVDENMAEVFKKAEIEGKQVLILKGRYRI